MNQPVFVRWTFRVLLTWMFVSLTGMYFSVKILEATVPLILYVSSKVQSDFIPHVDLFESGGTTVVRMGATLPQPLKIAPAVTLPPGDIQGYIQTNVDHCMVPLVILVTTLLIWPIKSGITEIIGRAFIGFLGSLVTVCLTVPLFLVARVEMVFMEYAIAAKAQPDQPLMVSWVLFSEFGGRWLVAIIVAGICIALARKFSDLTGSKRLTFVC